MTALDSPQGKNHSLLLLKGNWGMEIPLPGWCCSGPSSHPAYGA